MANAHLDIEFDFDFLLFGLVSSAKESKLAWALNKEMAVALRKQEDVVLEFVKDKKLIVSNFLYDTNYLRFRLLKNVVRTEDERKTAFLLPELKEYDYFVMIIGETNEDIEPEIKTRFKQIEVIEFTERIDIHKLKSKDNLIL